MVRLGPEQRVIRPGDRDDMVDHRCWPLAPHAQRMLSQVRRPVLRPARIVSAHVGLWPIGVVPLASILVVHVAVAARHDLRAALPLTWNPCATRQRSPPLRQAANNPASLRFDGCANARALLVPTGQTSHFLIVSSRPTAGNILIRRQACSRSSCLHFLQASPAGKVAAISAPCPKGAAPLKRGREGKRSPPWQDGQNENAPGDRSRGASDNCFDHA